MDTISDAYAVAELVPHSSFAATLRACASTQQRSRVLPETLVRSSVLRTVDGRTLEMDVRRWMAPADQVDESLLDRAIGPVLDVGCGPGRHVSSLLGRGVEAMGIDTSPTAVRLARRRGAPVAHQSVFDAVPDAGCGGARSCSTAASASEATPRASCDG